MKDAGETPPQEEVRDKKFYVYEFRDDTGKIFYVGKGTGNRMRSHRSPANQKPGIHLYNKIKKMWREGRDYTEEIVFETDVEADALAEEIRRIAFYGMENLCNTTRGGEGISGYRHTEESRKKMSENYNGKRGDEHYSRTNPEKLARGDRSFFRKYPERIPRGDNHWMKKNPELVLRGEKHHAAKLNEKLVYELRVRYVEGEYLIPVASELGLSVGGLWSAIRGHSWKNVPMPPGFKKRVNDLLPEETIEEIGRRYLKGDVSLSELGREYGVSQTTVTHLIYGNRRGLKAIEGLPPRHKAIRLSDEKVMEVRTLAEQGVSFAEIGRRLGMTGMSAGQIAMGRVYKHLPVLPTPNCRTDFTNEEVYEIRLRYSRGGITQAKLAEEYGVKPCSISELISGKAFKNVPFPEGFGPATKSLRIKLTEAQVYDIRSRRMKGESYYSISKTRGVSRQQVRYVCNGTSRRNVGVPEGYKFPM